MLNKRPLYVFMSRSMKKILLSLMQAVDLRRKASDNAIKRFRRILRHRINKDTELPRCLKEVMDVWSMEDDGKHRLSFDNPQYIKVLRK